MPRSRRSRFQPLIAVALLLAGLGAPGTAQATPAPPPVTSTIEAAASTDVILLAGCHTGHRYEGSEKVGTKTDCIGRDSSAPSTERRWKPGQEYAFYITAGPWEGYWISESPRSYRAGKIAEKRFEPTKQVTFRVGRFVGYRFDSAFSAVIGTESFTLVQSAGAMAQAWAVINGQRYTEITGGPWSGYWIKNAQTPGASAFTAVRDNPPLPACKVADVTTRYTGYRHFAKTLLDWTYMVPRTYRPRDLVWAGNAGVRYGVYGPQKVRRVVMEDLRALNRAARGAGFGNLVVNSAYRSYDTQADWFDSYTASEGYQQALLYSNRAGHSGHQLGTTLDVNVYRVTGLKTWMLQNSWRYGFINSFPAGKTAKHCYGAEPWHYRYFGRRVALNIQESGLTEREWLWYARH